ncbi:MAG TPA: hypothetical protein VG710_16955 [Opitutus sp.]|nr:hypothetical protein [Opitutus sp.]
MGLTVHYQFRMTGTLPAEEAYALVRSAHRRAAEFVRRRGLARITPVRPADPASPWCVAFAKVRRPNGDIYHDVEPQRGWMFEVLPGRDSEPLTFALCRYPGSILVRGQRVRTGCRGWTYAGHCKTQYASLHGEAHFLHCHRAVIDLLRVWQRLGVEVGISDEGNYWPGRDETALLAEVRRMNPVVAALAGAAKDAADETGAPVQSPIFRHAGFERLEAEGLTRHGSRIAEALRAAAETAATTKPETRKPQREKSDDELI